MSDIISNDKQVAKELTLAVAAKMNISVKNGTVDFKEHAANIAEVFNVIYNEVKKD